MMETIQFENVDVIIYVGLGRFHHNHHQKNRLESKVNEWKKQGKSYEEAHRTKFLRKINS